MDRYKTRIEILGEDNKVAARIFFDASRADPTAKAGTLDRDGLWVTQIRDKVFITRPNTLLRIIQETFRILGSPLVP